MRVKLTLSVDYCRGRTVSATTEVETEEPMHETLVELVVAGVQGLQEALKVQGKREPPKRPWAWLRGH